MDLILGVADLSSSVSTLPVLAKLENYTDFMIIREVLLKYWHGYWLLSHWNLRIKVSISVFLSMVQQSL